MPRTSNMLSKMFYAAYGAEILRIARLKSTKTVFISYRSVVISRMINQGGNVNTISNTLSEKFCRYFDNFSNFYAASIEVTATGFEPTTT